MTLRVTASYNETELKELYVTMYCEPFHPNLSAERLRIQTPLQKGHYPRFRL
jgi:hypothetical protein